MLPLPEGVPALGAYQQVCASPSFRELEQASSAFAARHADEMSADPLRQWSRRWEYPFALSSLEHHLGSNGSVRILDAGSGFTFFPFLLAERLPEASIECVDMDAGLADAFARVDGNVDFRAGDLAAGLDEPDASFDAIVCLSVLEHVDDRSAALAELQRLLRPGGLVVLTFDVAIDGDYPIPVPACEQLLDEAARLFTGALVADRGRLVKRVRQDVLTTRAVAAKEPERMPWRNEFVATLGSFRRGFLPRSFGYRNLTVWCGRLRRI